MDRLGNLWANGGNLWRFDPKTEKFTEFPEGGHAYSLELDKKEARLVRATRGGEDREGRRQDTKTYQMDSAASVRLASINKDQPEEIGNTQTHPKSAGPRRITSDSQGIIWFGEWWRVRLAASTLNRKPSRNSRCPTRTQRRTELVSIATTLLVQLV